MIIKIFDQGTNKGNFIIQYLLSEEKHLGFDPKVLSGNPDVSKNIINSLSFKNKYVAGCLSFRQGEEITKAEQYELMERFEKTFCPFSDQSRVNFLWVEHRDKGGRLELNFLSPRIDLRTRKSFNLHPPGKANLLFFESFVRIENLRYGFEQVDSKEMTSKDARFYADVLTDLYGKRKEYLINKYDLTTKIRKGSKHARRTNTKGFTAKYSQFRNLGDVYKHKAFISGSFQQSANTGANRYAGSSKTADDYGTKTTGSDGFSSQGFGAREVGQSTEGYSKHASDSLQGILKLMNSKPVLGLPMPSMSIEDELYSLGVQLSTCSPSEAPAIQARIDYLKGIQSAGGGKGGAGSIGGGMGATKAPKPKK